MLYFIVTTTKCNLKCRYCGNDPRFIPEPLTPSYDIETLKKFLSGDEKLIVCFYGGEPLLNIEFIEEVMDEIEAFKWVVQTNGLHLNKLKPKYLRRFDTILVSIDGREEITDYYRGRGVYRRVLENCKLIRERGFKGDLIARMVISGKSDVYTDVRHLAEMELFDHVHWQIDAMYDYPPYSRYSNFDKWIEENYNPGIDKLIEYWITELQCGKLVPFQGIMKRILYERNCKIPCGAGIDSFTIATSGKIYACPIAQGQEDFYLGKIEDTTPDKLPGKIVIGEPCTSCSYYPICGGRCLYANRTKLWGEEGYRKVCKTVIHTIRMLLKDKHRILEMPWKVIEEKLRYPYYNNTTEIIP